MKDWQNVNVLYQIYPRSFQDTNGDGVGDLPGITQRLEYVSTTLGVDAIWISPFYPSPQADCGYDVSDYCAVDPLFGTMYDLEVLLASAHEQGLRVMLDLVPNHTSDQHAWFQESRSSRDNPKRDWYVWRDQPTNWVSISGGSSWTFDEMTGQYYLHSFMSTQPDLNWEHPEVRAAIKDAMRFWFQKGVDGFRVDAVWVLSKHTDFPDEPANETYNHPGEYGGYIHTACKNGPRLQEYLEEIAGVAREFPDKRILFEFYPDSALGDSLGQLELLHHVSPDIATPFYFEGIHFPWHAEQCGRLIEQYLSIVPAEARPSFCFSNHDQSRLVSRYGEERARLVAVLLMTLPGLPVMYYGDELGMEDGVIAPELTKDKFEKTGDSGGRDPERTPMQWDDSRGAGFTSGEPWLPIGESSLRKNVAQELCDEHSWLSLYMKLIDLRHEAVMQRGSFSIVKTESGYILAYERRLEGQCRYVVLNFAAAAQVVSLPQAVLEVLAVSKPGAITIRDDGRVSIDGYGAAVLAVVSDRDS